MERKQIDIDNLTENEIFMLFTGVTMALHIFKDEESIGFLNNLPFTASTIGIMSNALMNLKEAPERTQERLGAALVIYEEVMKLVNSDEAKAELRKALSKKATEVFH